MKKKALYISSFIPNSISTHAGGQAAYQNLSDLKNEGYDVTTLICTTEDIPLSKENKKTFIFKQNKIQLLLGYLYNIISLKFFGFFSWDIFDTRSNFYFERLLKNELSKKEYDLVFVDFTQSFLPVIRAISYAKERPTLFCCPHDLFIQKYLRRNKIIDKIRIGFIAKTENKILSQFDKIILLSEKDNFLAKYLYDLENLYTRPWSPPKWVKNVRRSIQTINSGEILFFANFNRPENSEALNWFLNHSWLNVKQSIPNAKLVIAGTGSDQIKIPSNLQGIERSGFIENPASLFERCELSIAPLAYGAGIKFKVLEALSCGVPIVGTTVAFEGIEESNLTYRSNRENFDKTIISLIKRGNNSTREPLKTSAT